MTGAMAPHSVMGWWAFGLGEAAACLLLLAGFAYYLRLALANAAEQDRPEEGSMTQRITLAADAIDAHPVHIDVSDEDALAYVEAFGLLDERRRSEGRTPLPIVSVEEVGR